MLGSRASGRVKSRWQIKDTANLKSDLKQTGCGDAADGALRNASTTGVKGGTAGKSTKCIKQFYGNRPIFLLNYVGVLLTYAPTSPRAPGPSPTSPAYAPACAQACAQAYGYHAQGSYWPRPASHSRVLSPAATHS